MKIAIQDQIQTQIEECKKEKLCNPKLDSQIIDINFSFTDSNQIYNKVNRLKK